MKFNKLADSAPGAYLKLKDGESITIIPRGEIFSFRIRWEGGKAQEIPENDPKRHNRFKLNAFVSEGGTFVPKIWEIGIMVYNTLAEFATEMDITKSKIKVTRKGSGTDTVYVLVPLGPVDAKSLSVIESIPLNILASKSVGSPYPKTEKAWEETPPKWTTEEAPYEDSDIPF